jgi:hypothetical protein
VVDACKCGNESSGSINAGNFLTENRLAFQEALCTME